MTRLSPLRVLLAIATVLSFAAPSRAQDPQDDDRVLKPAEPDFTIIALPTALRLPEHKLAFRVTHRMTRPLDCDDCPNSLLGDAFGLDTGAQIGLELRYSPFKDAQVGVHRTSDKTIAFFAQYGVIRQGVRLPVEVAALASIDGSENFTGS